MMSCATSHGSTSPLSVYTRIPSQPAASLQRATSSMSRRYARGDAVYEGGHVANTFSPDSMSRSVMPPRSARRETWFPNAGTLCKKRAVSRPGSLAARCGAHATLAPRMLLAPLAPRENPRHQRIRSLHSLQTRALAEPRRARIPHLPGTRLGGGTDRGWNARGSGGGGADQPPQAYGRFPQGGDRLLPAGGRAGHGRRRRAGARLRLRALPRRIRGRPCLARPVSPGLL